MTKISNKIAYKVKNSPAITDCVIGTNSEKNLSELVENQTVNFPLSAIQSLILGGLSPDLGGQLKITEIEPITVETDISTIVNALNPHYVVGRYEIVCFNINGQIYLLKSQNLTIGFDGTALTNDDFVEFPVSVGATGADGADGIPGTNGTNGKEVELRTSGNWIQWKYTTDLTWTNLIDINGLKGADGVSITADGDSTTVSGDGSILTPYVVEIKPNYSWTLGSLRQLEVDATYVTTNFDSSGLGRLEMLGWAICNGANGTIDRRGRTSIAYDDRNTDPSTGFWDIAYNTLGNVLGLLKVKLTANQSGVQPHSHIVPTAIIAGGSVGGSGTAAFGPGATFNNVAIDAIDFHENRQPSIVDLWIKKVS